MHLTLKWRLMSVVHPVPMVLVVLVVPVVGVLHCSNLQQVLREAPVLHV